MIKIFSSNDKTFNSNGDIVINPIKAKVHKQDNGDYYLDLETSLDSDNIQYAMNGMPGALLTMLMPRVLNSEVANIEANDEYISVTIKEPTAAANEAAK